MGFRKFLFGFIILFNFVCPAAFANKMEGADNYLIGMTISKVKDGFYTVGLQFKNDTNEQYEAKDLGNNTYAIMLPQIKSIMEDENITFSDVNPDLDVTISENKNFTNKKNFQTKIKFKAPKETTLQVLSYGKSDLPIDFDENNLKNEQSEQNITFSQISDWLLYASIGLIVLLIILMICYKRNNDEFEEEENPPKNNSLQPLQEKNIPITERNSSVFDVLSNSEQPVETLKNFQSRKEEEQKIQEEKTDTTDETDKIVDELVQVVIPKNDLVLMPGVPELPGLEAKDKKNKTTKTVLDNVKVDLFDAENFEENQQEKSENTEQMSLADRINLMNERNEILENISPLGDIVKTADELQPQEEHPLPDEYEKLLNSFKKTLKFAHKIKDNEDLEPEVIDAFAVDENTGFSLVKMGEKISFVGNIGEKLFVIKTFTPEELNNDTLFMEFCTQTPTYCAYSVILNKFKALVKVTPTEISLIGDYGE